MKSAGLWKKVIFVIATFQENIYEAHSGKTTLFLCLFMPLALCRQFIRTNDFL